MKRPINIKPQIYDFFLEKCESEMKDALENPIKYLIKYDIFSPKNIDLLQDTVFALRTEENVLITKETIADVIDEGKIHVIRLFDKMTILLPKTTFFEDFSGSDEFDYIEE